MAVAAVKVNSRRPVAAPRRGAWMVDKHINISVIIAVILQSVGLVVWGSTLTARVGELEMKVSAMAMVSERLVRIETITGATQEAIRELKGLLTPIPKR